MTTGQRIIQAVTPVVPICQADLYTGEAEEYCTFTTDSSGGLYADDRLQFIVQLVRVHWFLPLGTDPEAKKKQLIQRLTEAGFGFSGVTCASDKGGQHFVFQCQYAQGADEGGF